MSALSTTRRLLLGGIAAAAVPAGAVVAQVASPDAEMVRLAERIETEHTETDRIITIVDETEDGAEASRLSRIVSARVASSWEMRADLAQMQATTLDGFRAKARVVRLFDYAGDGYAEPYSDDAVSYSLANDLLGLPTVWREDEA